jgi:hypothetical protein
VHAPAVPPGIPWSALPYGYMYSTPVRVLLEAHDIP